MSRSIEALQAPEASKKGRLTLQRASDIASYSPEDVYKPRQGADGVKGLGLKAVERCEQRLRPSKSLYGS